VAVAAPAGGTDTNTANNTALDTDTLVLRPRLGDFNSDGFSDIALYNRVTREVRFWNMGAGLAHTEVPIGFGAVALRSFTAVSGPL